jgi:hydroxymethylbilane synthase
MSIKTGLVIGTRGSPLALAQARMTAGGLARLTGLPESAFPLDIITTTGDATQDRALSEIGGKGLFTKEIDSAQLEGRIDLSVHSAKDLPTELPDGLVIAGYLPREDVRDALIAPRHHTLAALPHGARIGTVSLRRQALLRQMRPDLAPETLRGNVETRLNKAKSGEFEAVILAMAGLNRLGLARHVTEVLDAQTFTPAVGQGAIALVIRTGDARAQALVDGIAHPATMIEVTAERAFLKVLDGSCRTPIGGNARVEGEKLRFQGIVLTSDGTHVQRVTGEAPLAEAEQLGTRMGEAAKASPAFALFKSA